MPVSLPRSFFAQLSSLVSTFIWDNRRQRIALRLLSRHRDTGGLGLPDTQRYYRAIALQRILNWRFHTQYKIWVSLEKYMAGRNLSYAPWLVREHRGLSDTTSPLMIQALKTWDRLNANLLLAPPVSPLALLGGYLWFPPGEQAAFFSPWVDDGTASCEKLMQVNTSGNPRDQAGSFPLDFWRYRQLHHFFKTQENAIWDISALTPFEHLFIVEEPAPHMIIEFYQLLSSAASTVKPPYVRAWERDLETVFTPAQLSSLYQLTRSSSIDSKTQELNYKILLRWYRIPADLTRTYSSISDQCWRGCGHRGTLLHSWWECPVFRPYWEDIKSQIKEITGIDIPLSAIHFLLHIPPMPEKPVQVKCSAPLIKCS